MNAAGISNEGSVHLFNGSGGIRPTLAIVIEARNHGGILKYVNYLLGFDAF